MIGTTVAEVGKNGMIQVKVYLPMCLPGHSVDQQGCMSIPEGSQLKDLIHRLGMTKWIAKFFQVKLNGLPQPMETVLQDGDTVSFFSLIQGG
mgnify:CR=1 FL=1